MTAGIVNELELVKVKIEQCVPQVRVLAHALDGFGEPVLELATVDESGKGIMTGLVMQRAVQAPLLADVVEYDDRAGQVPIAIVDRRSRMLHIDALPLARHERRLLRQSEWPVLAQHLHDRALDG